MPKTAKADQLTRDDVANLVTSTEAQMEAWRDAEDDQVPTVELIGSRGVCVRIIPPDIEAEIDRLAAVIDRDDAEPEAWRVILAADRFLAKGFNPWRRRRDDLPSQHSSIRRGFSYCGDQGMWSEWSRLVQHVTSAEPETRNLESIDELTAAGVTPRQQCVVYHWIDCSGQPDLDRWNDASADADFVPPPNPADQRWLEVIERRWSERVNKRSQQAARPVPSYGPRPRRPPR